MKKFKNKIVGVLLVAFMAITGVVSSSGIVSATNNEDLGISSLKFDQGFVAQQCKLDNDGNRVEYNCLVGTTFYSKEKDYPLWISANRTDLSGTAHQYLESNFPTYEQLYEKVLEDHAASFAENYYENLYTHYVSIRGSTPDSSVIAYVRCDYFLSHDITPGEENIMVTFKTKQQGEIDEVLIGNETAIKDKTIENDRIPTEEDLPEEYSSYRIVRWEDEYGNEVDFTNQIITEPVTFYAVLEKDTQNYTLKYISNDDKNTVFDDSQRYEENTNANVKDAVSTIGYTTTTVKNQNATFVGWSTEKMNPLEADAAEPAGILKPGGSLVMDTNKTLYAVWRLEKADFSESVVLNKKANLIDWSNRIYDIKLDATSKVSNDESQTSTPNDIVLVLDFSDSMKQSGEYVYTELGEFKPGDLERNKEYYIKVNNQYYQIHKSKNSKDWYYEKNNQRQYLDSNTSYTIYSNRVYKTRLAILKSAVKELIDELSRTAPNTRIAIVPFTHYREASQKYSIGFTSLETPEKIKNLKNELDKLEVTVDLPGTGTRPDYGLEKARNLLENDINTRPDQVILFTDGAPDDGVNSEETLRNHIYNEALKLHGQEQICDKRGCEISDFETNVLSGDNEKIYTIGIGISYYYENWYKNEVADTDCFYSADDMTALSEIFKEINDSINVGKPITGATIKDYIDPRFKILVQDSSGNWVEAKEGDTVGNKQGTVHYDVSKKQYYVEWTEQTIEYKKEGEGTGWEDTIRIQAKSDFLGGNAIVTNGDGSGVYKDSDYKAFDDPTVNVKTIDKLCASIDVNKIYGEQINIWDEVIKNLDDDKYKVLDLLTSKEIETLKEDGTITIPYKYKGTSDIVGNITFTVTPKTNLDGSHKLSEVSKKEGSELKPAETYTLNIKYVPFTENDRVNAGNIRPNDTFDNKETGGRFEALTNGKDHNGCTGIGNVYVKAGKLTINKTIDEFDSKGGDPIFIYKISYTDINGKNKVVYRTVRFTQDDESKNNLVGTVDNLPKGTKYKVQELDSIKYVLDGITSSNQEDKIDKGTKSVTFDIDKDNLDHTVTYINKLNNNNIQTDKDVVVNKVSEDSEGHIVFDKDNLKE